MDGVTALAKHIKNRDNIHLSYLGAMKYAELVAQSMSDQGVPFINKDFSWSVEDKSGNTISVQVK